MVIEILAYLSVGLITLGWLIPISSEMIRTILKKMKRSEEIESREREE